MELVTLGDLNGVKLRGAGTRLRQVNIVIEELSPLSDEVAQSIAVGHRRTLDADRITNLAGVHHAGLSRRRDPVIIHRRPEAWKQRPGRPLVRLRQVVFGSVDGPVLGIRISRERSRCDECQGKQGSACSIRVSPFHWCRQTMLERDHGR